MSKPYLQYYELRLVTIDEPPVVATAALITCVACGDVISGYGGPGENPFCVPCAEVTLAEVAE